MNSATISRLLLITAAVASPLAAQHSHEHRRRPRFFNHDRGSRRREGGDDVRRRAQAHGDVSCAARQSVTVPAPGRIAKDLRISARQVRRHGGCRRGGLQVVRPAVEAADGYSTSRTTRTRSERRSGSMRPSPRRSCTAAAGMAGSS